MDIFPEGIIFFVQHIFIEHERITGDTNDHLRSPLKVVLDERVGQINTFIDTGMAGRVHSDVHFDQIEGRDYAGYLFEICRRGYSCTSHSSGIFILKSIICIIHECAL